MPFLLIPLINEAFGTSYGEDQEIIQLRNEHFEKSGKFITDSNVEIFGHKYHIEYQSQKDEKMTLRMFEYDVAIAIEQSSGIKTKHIKIFFPESCVLYLRNHRDMPNSHTLEICFPNSQSAIYETKVIMAQDYTVDKIFEKSF